MMGWVFSYRSLEREGESIGDECGKRHSFLGSVGVFHGECAESVLCKIAPNSDFTIFKGFLGFLDCHIFVS